MQILWLCGPPGVGKSSVGWEIYQELRQQGVRIAYVDIDQVGMCYPARDEDPDRHRLKAYALASIVPNYAAVGCTALVVSGVLGPDLFPLYEELLRPYDLVFCRLTVGMETLHARLAGEGLADADLEAIRRYAAALESFGIDNAVDTAGRSVAEVASLVLSMHRWHATEARRSDAPVPALVPSGRAGVALGFCGPEAAGKSTVAWQAFLRLQEAGMTGFLDLAQLSFSTEKSAAAVLQANNAAALWTVFTAGGAERLVLAGRLPEAAEVSLLRSALPSMRMTVVRLWASRAALEERMLLRTRGEGPQLAGDQLAGLSAEAVRPRVEPAWQEMQYVAEHGEHDLVLDTTELRPADAATVAVEAAKFGGGQP